MHQRLSKRLIPLLMFVLFALASGCSLIATRDGYRFDGEEPDAGSRDAGARDGGDGDGGPGGPTGAPTLRFPWNGYTTGSAHTGALGPGRNALRPLFLWEPVAGAEEYEIQLSSACEARSRQSCTFSGAISDRASDTSWRPVEALAVSTAAPVGRRYVWRLRACNAAGCGPWSEVRYVDVGRQPTDYNGDGYADLAAGARRETGGVGSMSSGQVHIYRGPALEHWGTLVNETTVPSFGLGVASAGDFNADGFGDLLVASSAQLHIYFGHATFGPGRLDRDEEALGWDLSAMCGGGDLDGDGDAEVLISYQNAAADGARSAGEVLLYLGGTGSLTQTRVLNSPSPVDLGFFGSALASDGDLNGDGYADLAIGARGEPGGGNASAGRVYLYAGGPEGLPEEPTALLINPTLPVAGGYFGASLAMADLNGDGLAELIVGATGEGPEGNGQVHVFMGHPELAGEAVTLSATATGANFGSRVSAGWGPEGGRRIVVSDPSETIDGLIDSTGRVHIFDLARPEASTYFFEPTDPYYEPQFGEYIAHLGDVLGDGRGTLAIGTPIASPRDMALAGSVFVSTEPTSGSPDRTEILSPTSAMAGSFGSVGGTHYLR